MVRRPLAILLWLACGCSTARAYSVLTHEAVIDSAWEQYIKPALLARFPQSTPEDLIKAHAYAYGGCIIQDMGYYPFGSHLFSDLTHYVRSGDFVENMLRDSQDLNEYAFAMGTLAHYAGDTIGHPEAVNASVGLLYPKLRSRYGKEVTYTDDPAAHLKTEFGFDVVQVANHVYAPDAYHAFIGFEVSKPLLDRGFFDTYGIHLNDVFSDLDLALGTYRRSVANILPAMTKAAWSAKKKDIVRLTPGMTRRRFIYIISRSSYRKEWGRNYEQPGFWARFWAFLFKLIPKIGPFRAFAFTAPTPQTEQLFMKSFEGAFNQFRENIAESRQNRLHLKNENLDVGKPTVPATYNLADRAYATLLDKSAQKQFAGMNAAMRSAILAYYDNLNLDFATKKKPKDWEKTMAELQALRNATLGAAAAGTP